MYHGTVMVKPCGALRLLKGYLPNDIYFDDPNNIDPQWLQCILFLKISCVLHRIKS